MFRNKEELQETFNILENEYKNHSTVYKPFKIEGNSITFEGDSYFDPVLTLLSLSGRGIINAKISYAGSEIDKMTITGANIEALRKLNERWPSWNTVEKKLDQLGYKKIEAPSPKGYIIDEGEKSSVISNGTWKKYWEIKNEEPNPWNIPTSEEIYNTVGIFKTNNKDKNSKPNITLKEESHTLKL